MKKIALIGSRGQLGFDLAGLLKKDKKTKLFALTSDDLDISDPRAVYKVFKKINPDIILNTAAYHRVEEIEQNPDKAFLINASANLYLSKYCSQNKKTLVFLSTDYVFGKDSKRKKPYIESDCPEPVNVYGVSKLAGEKIIQAICPNHFIVRTSSLFGVAGSSGKGGNFVETMLSLNRENKTIKVVNDQIATPTFTLDLAKQICNLIKTAQYGLYHVTSEGSCSWFEFAETIFKFCKIKADLVAIKTANLNLAVKRPNYSVLENKALKKISLNQMRPWQEGLKEYLSLKGYL